MHIIKVTFDALRDDRVELLKGVRTFGELWERYAADTGNQAVELELDGLIAHMPDRVWIEC
jgi:hypothetical protein